MRRRSGASLIDDVYIKTDMEAFTDRYPRSEILRHINQGGAELWDIILDAKGKAFGRSSTPWEISTTEDTIEYTSSFPDDFLEVLHVRMTCPYGAPLDPLASPEEAFHRDGTSQGVPLYYDVIPGGVQLFPKHQAGCCVVVEYAVAFTDLTDSASSYYDGINGWEDYLVCHAAREVALKEGEIPFAREMSDEKQRIEMRVRKRAAKRDNFRPRSAKDIRGARWR